MQCLQSFSNGSEKQATHLCVRTHARTQHEHTLPTCADMEKCQSVLLGTLGEGWGDFSALFLQRWYTCEVISK